MYFAAFDPNTNSSRKMVLKLLKISRFSFIICKAKIHLLKKKRKGQWYGFCTLGKNTVNMPCLHFQQILYETQFSAWHILSILSKEKWVQLSRSNSIVLQTWYLTLFCTFLNIVSYPKLISSCQIYGAKCF